MTVKNTKPDVRRDRVAVLASTIVREIAAARIQDLERMPTDPPEAAEVRMTPRLTKLVEHYDNASKAKKAAEAAIERLGYRFCRSEAGVVTVKPPYGHNGTYKARKKDWLAKRCNAVRELRTNTLIDLVTLDEREAKRVVSKFRADVEAL